MRKLLFICIILLTGCQLTETPPITLAPQSEGVVIGTIQSGDTILNGWKFYKDNSKVIPEEAEGTNQAEFYTVSYLADRIYRTPRPTGQAQCGDCQGGCSITPGLGCVCEDNQDQTCDEEISFY